MLKVSIEAVEKCIIDVADSIIVPRFNNLRSHEISFKIGDDPVTIADIEAESALKARLLDLLPGSKVVGEEEFASNPGVLKHFLGDYPVWTIDPVDGTRCFVAGKPYYGVIVSLSQQDQAVAAWLYDPTSREFVTAEKGNGAYHKGKKLKVMSPVPLVQMAGLAGKRITAAHRRCESKVPPGPTMLAMHSSCHDYARLVVQSPHFSKKLPPVHFHTWKETCTPWDSVAGIMIHKEAGGYTAHWDGEPYRSGDYGLGTLSAPCQESWREIADWIKTFCNITGH